MRKLGKRFAVSAADRSVVVKSWSSHRRTSASNPITKPTSVQLKAEMTALDNLLKKHPVVNTTIRSAYLKSHSVHPRQYAIMLAVARKAFPKKPSSASDIVAAIEKPANVTHEQANSFAQFMLWKWEQL